MVLVILGAIPFMIIIIPTHAAKFMFHISSGTASILKRHDKYMNQWDWLMLDLNEDKITL